MEATEAPPTAEESIQITTELVDVTSDNSTTMDDVILTSELITVLTSQRSKVKKRKEQVKEIIDVSRSTMAGFVNNPVNLSQGSELISLTYV